MDLQIRELPKFKACLITSNIVSTNENKITWVKWSRRELRWVWDRKIRCTLLIRKRGSQKISRSLQILCKCNPLQTRMQGPSTLEMRVAAQCGWLLPRIRIRFRKITPPSKSQVSTSTMITTGTSKLIKLTLIFTMGTHQLIRNKCRSVALSICKKWRNSQ